MKVWLADRLYPVIPVFNITENIPNFVHTIFFGLSLASLLLLLLFPQYKRLIIIAVFIEIASCLLDVTRWQPWEYQYIFTLLLFIFNKNNQARLNTALIFMMASIYIFSGLHKLNGGFLHTIWESMMLRRFFGLSTEMIVQYKLHYVGSILPILEIAGGLGLLVLKHKKWPALLLVGMHMYILTFLGPLGLNYNIIVWPWNAAMAILLGFLFLRGEMPVFSPLEMVSKWNIVVLIFWGVLPVLSFSGYWGQYLSSSLYSGKTLNMDICVADSHKIPQLQRYFIKRDVRNICNGNARIGLQQWGFSEMRVPPYPEEWYYRRFKEQWEKKFGKANARFIMYAYPYKEKKEIE